MPTSSRRGAKKEAATTALASSARVRIKNRQRRLVEVNLDHPDLARKVQHQSVDHNPKTGVRGIRQSQRRVFGSLMMLAREIKEVPALYIKSPSVQAAIARGDLVVLKAEKKR